MFVGMIDALAFVPLGHLYVAEQVLINNIPDRMLQPLLDYFLTNYVFGPVIPNRVPPANAPPMFLPQLWDIFQVPIQGGSRINNICEGWNHSFNLTVGQRHPPFYKAIEIIQKDYAKVKRDMIKSQHGTPLTQAIRHEIRT